MTAAFERWDWRLSAYMRLVSTGAVWVLVFFASLMGPLLPALGLLRMIFGGAQLGLNHGLSRRTPLAGRDRLDWLLLLLAFLGSIVSASVVQATGTRMPLFVLPLLLPYSVLQLRSYRRSLEAHHSLSAPEPLSPIPFPLAAAAAPRRAA